MQSTLQHSFYISHVSCLNLDLFRWDTHTSMLIAPERPHFLSKMYFIKPDLIVVFQLIGTFLECTPKNEMIFQIFLFVSFSHFIFLWKVWKYRIFKKFPLTRITTLYAGSLMGPHFKVRISMGEYSFPIERVGIVVFTAFPSMAHPAQTGQSSFFIQWPLPCHLSSITYSDKDILLLVGLGQIYGQGKGNLESQFSTIFSGSCLEAWKKSRTSMVTLCKSYIIKE